MEKLSKNFTRAEFACKCGCGLDKIDPLLIDLLQKARDIHGMSMTITSGCRCKTHNKKVGGMPDSAHLPSPKDGLCKAADIACSSGYQMFSQVVALLNAGFKRIGINFQKNFVHVDVDETKPQNVIFKY